MTTAPRLQPVPEETAPDDLKAAFAEVRAALGFIPDSFRMMANHPDFFKGFWQHMKAVSEPKRIDAKTKVMLAIAIFAATNCQYGLNAQTRRLRALGADDAELTELFAVIAFWQGLGMWNNAVGL
ncbi:MAG: carboxymuconolactone decarboxylase family protein [Candidatus Tectomicrobia bacterium]|nr:carboxymuconolactone decarboxylase family protein [Candidatus Tectomicrobia bacterium]